MTSINELKAFWILWSMRRKEKKYIAKNMPLMFPAILFLELPDSVLMKLLKIVGKCHKKEWPKINRLMPNHLWPNLIWPIANIS